MHSNDILKPHKHINTEVDGEIFSLYVMKIQCQNIMLNNIMSLSVSSVVAIVFTKAVFFLFCLFAVNGVR